MGMLIYNGRMSLPLDDRTLAHIQAVVVNKLRRRESFAFTAMVDGTEVVSWIGASTPLVRRSRRCWRTPRFTTT